MIDESEREEILEPVEERERRLERLGPVWKTPQIPDVRLPRNFSLLGTLKHIWQAKPWVARCHILS